MNLSKYYAVPSYTKIAVIAAMLIGLLLAAQVYGEDYHRLPTPRWQVTVTTGGASPRHRYDSLRRANQAAYRNQHAALADARKAMLNKKRLNMRNVGRGVVSGAAGAATLSRDPRGIAGGAIAGGVAASASALYDNAFDAKKYANEAYQWSKVRQELSNQMSQMQKTHGMKVTQKDPLPKYLKVN